MKALRDLSSWEQVGVCPLCGSPQRTHQVFEHAQVDGQALQYKLCRKCGLVFQSPRLVEKALDDFYTSDYRQLVQGQEGPTEKDLRVQHGRARVMVDFLEQEVPAVSRHLDIGCSSGALLSAVASNYGCAAVGIEPGDAYRSFAQQRGFEVYRDLDELEEGQEATFDLVSMSHVIEHLPDPVQVLRRIRERWLEAGGFLLLETPNLFGHQCFELAHLSAYTASTLKTLLQQAGFESQRLKRHGQPRSKLIPLYLTVLARPRAGVLSSSMITSNPRAVRAGRKVGNAWRRLAAILAPGWAWLPWPEMDE